MSEEQLFEKNLEISTEFSKYLLSHPELESQIPERAQLVFLLDSDPELTQENLKLAREQKMKGEQILFVHARGLRPEVSRLIEPRLEKKAVGF